MRISDWSSDVCASDLRHLPGGEVGEPVCASDRGSIGGLVKREPVGFDLGCESFTQSRWRMTKQQSGHRLCGQRIAPGLGGKSGGWGTRASLRVDVGGRRIIKKKQQERKCE